MAKIKTIKMSDKERILRLEKMIKAITKFIIEVDREQQSFASTIPLYGIEYELKDLESFD